jgi:purine-nucleoside phosphorylase
MRLNEKIDVAVEAIRKATAFRSTPAVGVILGSGLGQFADLLEQPKRVAYADVPEFPRASVEGHKGHLVIGSCRGVSVVAMQGRVHFYEGYAPWQVGFAARVLCRMGIGALMVTNASGGINLNYAAGDFMAISDHINLSGFNPLVGPNENELGPRFPDMTHTYSKSLLARLLDSAKSLDIVLHQGVYASVSGPSYETPAEIRMLRAMGADAVGMSTVPEVIVAAHMGVPVVGLSCITNVAAGISSQKLSHADVASVANQRQEKFTSLLSTFIGQFHTDKVTT